MKVVKVTQITNLIESLLLKANFELPPDVTKAIENSIKKETSPIAIKILNLILENASIAKREKLPLCQDCGNVYVNLYVGKDICIEDCDESDNTEDEKGDIDEGSKISKDERNYTDKDKIRKIDNIIDNMTNIDGVDEVPVKDILINTESSVDKIKEDVVEKINSTIAKVYKESYLRKSIVSDPLFERKNTGVNTPAIVDFFFCLDPGIDVEVCLKGGGSENCSYLFMLNPSAGKEKIIEIVLDVIKENASYCCPPVVIGVGIGSTASKVVELAKKASFRNLDIRNKDPRYRKLEEEILEKVNSTGIGPQGLGGKTTALACNIEFSPCHMATLPLAISLGCHSTRRASSKILF